MSESKSGYWEQCPDCNGTGFRGTGRIIDTGDGRRDELMKPGCSCRVIRAAALAEGEAQGRTNAFEESVCADVHLIGPISPDKTYTHGWLDGIHAMRDAIRAKMKQDSTPSCKVSEDL